MNQHPPLVYIVILNWNGWKDTLKCLRSISEISYQNYQIIVVDNGSKDDSVKQIKAAFPKIELLRSEKNLGFGGGCNIGIEHALSCDADYVWLLNNDMTVNAASLTCMVSTAEADARIGAVGSVIYWMDKPSEVQEWGGGAINICLGTAKVLLVSAKSEDHLHYICGGSALLRSAALREIGGFDSQRYFLYWEDPDLCFRMRARGWKLRVTDLSKVFHRGSAGLGRRSYRQDYYFNQSAVRFFLRHSPWPWWSIVMGVTLRLCKRLLKLDLRACRAVIIGVMAGLQPISASSFKTPDELDL